MSNNKENVTVEQMEIIVCPCGDVFAGSKLPDEDWNKECGNYLLLGCKVERILVKDFKWGDGCNCPEKARRQHFHQTGEILAALQPAAVEEKKLEGMRWVKAADVENVLDFLKAQKQEAVDSYVTSENNNEGEHASNTWSNLHMAFSISVSKLEEILNKEPTTEHGTEGK